LLEIVVAKPKSGAGHRFIYKVEKGAKARDVIYSMIESGE
jgi:hypothetical protein